MINSEKEKSLANTETEREKILLDKIDELEEQKRKLANDVQDYKNDLRALKEDIQKDEEIYEKCIDKLKKYKAKNIKLSDRIVELETDNHQLHDHLSTLEDTNIHSHATKKKSKSTKGSEEKVSFLNTFFPINLKTQQKRRRSLERDSDEEKSSTLLNIKEKQVRELDNEVRGLSEINKSLRQTNLELLHKNNELEKQLEENEILGQNSRIEYPKKYHNENQHSEHDSAFWKGRCETLVRKYVTTLRDIKEENARLKAELLDEMDYVRGATTKDLKALKREYKNRIHDLEEKKTGSKGKQFEGSSQKTVAKKHARSKSIKGKSFQV